MPTTAVDRWRDRSMEIRFSCGSCGKRYIVPGEISRRVVRCAGCGLDMVIPSASGAEVSEPAPAKLPLDEPAEELG
jgi:ribosomal protein S27E